MKISFGTRIGNIDKVKGTNGYGYATKCMLESLQRLGYQVESNDASADVEIWFDQPHNWNFSPNTYKIGYHPWESTLLIPGWAEIMNQCDEIWTPSPLIASWYRAHAGVTAPVYVYEHGIEHSWAPVKRQPEHTIKFLHVGGEASRKGLWDTLLPAFKQAFNGHRKDVTLTAKMINSKWNRIPSLGRIKFVDQVYTFDQMRYLFYTHDVLVHPSHGEGFGLPPLQALATGMPTIAVPDWAPYSRYLDDNLNVGADLRPTTWPEIHPGKMLRPRQDELIESLRFAAENYDQVRDFACSNAADVHADYDWDRLTKDMFEGLEDRLKNS